MKNKTGLRFDTRQLDFLRKIEKKTGQASAKAIAKTGAVMLQEIKKSVNMAAFSQAQLAGMDHPYAKRHGKIGNLKGRPSYAVGKNTGKFARTILGKTTNQYEYRIFYQDSEIGRYIVLGTRIMLARDPIGQTFQSRKTQQLFKKTLNKEFKRAMK
tara:strand:+ start:9983 stop:10450 length:468 start_codon:yes stop_codon:yes gene_type:complete